jgi:hypothetical protein
VESLTAAVSFARALIALERARSSGVLHVRSETCACRIAIEDGVVCASSRVRGAERTLGDALLADGELDVPAHERAIAIGDAASAPIGLWLVERGCASRPAVEVALRRQLRERVVRLFLCERIEYRFEAGASAQDVPRLDEPMPTVDLVLAGMRACVQSWPEAHALACLRSQALQLNATGRAFMRAALWPDEAVLIGLLARGTTLDAIRTATTGSLRALRLLAVLALISAVDAPQTRETSYALLVRKRGQLRHGDCAQALLDLPFDADAADARRALRRLARRVHPDALGPSAPSALRRASSEIMSALIEAERTMRAVEAP